MRTVHVLHHSYEASDTEETKLIGVYSSREAADRAVERLREQPGFRERPDAFTVDEFELDRDHWAEGFVSVAAILVPHVGGGEAVPVVAELLPDGTYRIVDSVEASGLLFSSGQRVRCRPRSSDDATLVAYELADPTTLGKRT